jgi:hypothetical protein
MLRYVSTQKAEAKLDVELRDHPTARDLIKWRRAHEARRRAQLQSGGIEQIKEDCRDVRGRWLEDFLGPAICGSNAPPKPGLPLVAVLSLGSVSAQTPQSSAS